MPITHEQYNEIAALASKVSTTLKRARDKEHDEARLVELAMTKHPETNSELILQREVLRLREEVRSLWHDTHPEAMGR